MYKIVKKIILISNMVFLAVHFDDEILLGLIFYLIVAFSLTDI
jgi:hypothetical protein